MKKDVSDFRLKAQTRSPGLTVGRRAASTTAAILKAAREEFVESGYESTTVDEIARRAGTSRGSIYTYFKSKRDILISLGIEGNDEFQTIAREFEEADLTDREVVSDVVTRYLDFLDSDASFSFVWREAGIRDAALRHEGSRQYKMAWRRMGTRLSPPGAGGDVVGARGMVVQAAFEMSWYYLNQFDAGFERDLVRDQLIDLIVKFAE
ncbi:MAG TPA: helix-turn-helix domain-containing protein [Longimicrobiales bacterium]|nr:helix-turn-helix domain-containing protein [Longimicrobiales bacterium]